MIPHHIKRDDEDALLKELAEMTFTWATSFSPPKQENVKFLNKEKKVGVGSFTT